MTDYNQYVTAINKIYDYLAKMKDGWNSLDNKNYIESIEEYQQLVTKCAEVLKSNPAPFEKLQSNMEVLGND